jgi:hypothetical protein
MPNEGVCYPVHLPVTAQAVVTTAGCSRSDYSLPDARAVAQPATAAATSAAGSSLSAALKTANSV